MKIEKIEILVAITCLCVCASAAAVSSQKAFLNSEEILTAWESTYGCIRTMSVSYRNVLVDFQQPQAENVDPDITPTNLVKHIQVERIEEGKRYHLRYSLAPEGLENSEWLKEFAFDGKVTQSYDGRMKSGVISLGLMGGDEDTKNIAKDYMFLKNYETPDILKDEYPNGIPELAMWFKLLKLRGKVIVRPNLEYTAGEACHVVEAIDDSDFRGKPREIKLVFWLAHDKGMCVMKYQRLGNGELEREIGIEKIGAADMDGNSIWYPQKAYRMVSGKKIGTIKTQLTVTDFVPNIPVDDNTFRLDYIEGTLISVMGSRKSCKWQKGMKFIVDERDNSICYVPETWTILVGVGKPLPQFEGIQFNGPAVLPEGTVMLICFFDMNQRPSRNCLQQLSERAKELKEKSIVVLAMQASKVDQGQLDEWVKKYNVPFSVGMVRDDEEKVRFAWGVKSLPWLILTDKEHIVQAEGFALTELDEKIKERKNAVE